MKSYKLRKFIITIAAVQLMHSAPAKSSAESIKRIGNNILVEDIMVAQAIKSKEEREREKILNRIATVAVRLDQLGYTGLKKDEDYMKSRYLGKTKYKWLFSNEKLLPDKLRNLLKTFDKNKNWLGLKMLFLYAATRDMSAQEIKKYANSMQKHVNEAEQRIKQRKRVRVEVPKRKTTDNDALIKKLLDERFAPTEREISALNKVSAEEIMSVAEEEQNIMRKRMMFALADYVKDGNKLGEVNAKLFYRAAILVYKGEKCYLFGLNSEFDALDTYIKTNYDKLSESEKKLFAAYLYYNVRHSLEDFQKIFPKKSKTNIDYFRGVMANLKDIYAQFSRISYLDDEKTIEQRLQFIEKRIRKMFGKNVSAITVLKTRIDFESMNNLFPDEMKADYSMKRQSFEDLVRTASMEIGEEQLADYEASKLKGVQPPQLTNEEQALLNSFLSNATYMDAYLLGDFWNKCAFKDPYTARTVLRTLLAIYKTDPYLVQHAAKYVLPTLSRVSNDESEFVRLLAGFGAEFSRRASPSRDLSSLFQRRYYIEKFREISKKLPKVLGFDYRDLSFDLWERPGGYEHPDYYNVKKSRVIPEERKSIPEYTSMRRYNLSLYPYRVPLLDPGRLHLNQDVLSMMHPEAKEVYSYANNLFNPEMRAFRAGVPNPYKIRRYNPDRIYKKMMRIFADFPGVAYSGELTSGNAVGGAYANEELWELGARGAIATTSGGASSEVIGGKISGRGEVRGRADASMIPISGPVQVHKASMKGNWREEEYVEGALQSFIQVAKEQRKDMLVYVYGYDRLPEEKGKFRERLYYVDKEGNYVQIAAGQDDYSRVYNYAFGEADYSPILLSAKAQHDLHDEYAFNGGALGFDVKDYVSMFGIANLPKGIPKEKYEKAEFGVGAGVKVSKTPDIIVANFRGFIPNEESRAKGIYVGELQWLRIPKDERAYAHIARAVGGVGTVGGEYRVEWTGERKYGVGASGGLETKNIIQNFPQLDEDASEYARSVKEILVNVYHWSEDAAEKQGWFIAGMYIYSKLYNLVDNADDKEIAKHYAQAIFMYWSDKHQILVGGEKMPHWNSVRNEIDAAVRNAEMYPGRADEYYQRAYDNIKNIMEKDDLWRFSIGWGWDGKVYVAGTFKSDEYANLRGIIAINEDMLIDMYGQAYVYFGERFIDAFGGVVWRDIGEIISLRADLGPTFSIDGDYSGMSGRGLVRFAKDNLALILGGMGGYKDLKTAKLDQWQIVLTGNVKNIDEGKLSEHTFYVGVNVANKEAVIVDESEWEMWRAKAGYEWSMMEIDDSGIHIFADASVGRINNISEGRNDWIATGQFGFRLEDYLSIAMFGGFNPPVGIGDVNMWWPNYVGRIPFSMDSWFIGLKISGTF